jgi:hypothetical protein
MTRCECGREHYPRQAWIHNPCRYLAGVDGRPEVEPNHVKPENRGYWLLPETERETETPKSETETRDETPWVKLGISKATYYRRRAG